MRWLLDCLSRFRQTAQAFDVQAASVWMDIDSVDFFSEPYDCAILLGNGHFGANTAAAKLFDEWLIPICAPALLADGQRDLAACPLIHPSPDRRDWRRWLQKAASRPRPILHAARYLIRWNRAMRRPSPGTASRSGIWR